MKPAAKRALILGLDAMVPTMTEKFLAEGILPNLARLLKRGVLTRVRAAVPAQTPCNWTTIATGATPGMHGIVQWGTHVPRGEVWEGRRAEAFAAGICRAEYLWETAARAGRRSVVMNYAGYPPTTKKAVFIDWLYQPSRSYFDVAPPAMYDSRPERDIPDVIELRPAQGWHELPQSNRPPLETEFAVVPSTEGAGPTYLGLVIARGRGYDTLLITEGRNASEPLAVLKARKWSDWFRAPFETADQGDLEGAFKFKLVELSADGSRLRVYRTDAFDAAGSFCSDSRLARRLIAELGPYVHSASTCSMHVRGLVDWQTTDELMAEEAAWWSRAAAIAMRATRASLLVLHWHNLDMMGHTFVQLVDPTGSSYDAAGADRHWDVIRDYYRAADRFVGAFMKEFDDGGTAFSVVSDHGMPANRKAVSLIELFRQRGWVTVTEDGKSVDWTRSKVFFSQNHLWLNLRGRNEGGIVPPERYEALRAEVLAAMRDIKDPDTGEHVFAFVLTREDAPMVGLWGDYIGDLSFCYAGGYRWAGGEVLAMGEKRLVFPCGGGNHGPMIPTFETEVASVLGTWVLAGPGVRARVKLPRLEQSRISTADVAPTVARLIGMEAPAQCEGRAVHEFLAGATSKRPARRFKPMARPIVWRKAVKKAPPKLQGDVTDEL